jgi:hypothetical protein
MKYRLQSITLLLILTASCKVHKAPEETPLVPIDMVDIQSIQTKPLTPLTCQSYAELVVFPNSLSGSHIVYQGTDKNGNFLMWSVDMSNGKHTLLKDYPGTVSRIGFLRDSQHFLIAIGDGKHAWLGNVNVTPATKIELTDEILGNFQAYSPVWFDIAGYTDEMIDYRFRKFPSPDNNTIAFWERGASALVLIDRETGTEKVVVPTGIQDEVSGRWTPDGKWFIFTYTHGTPENYYSQILRVSADGTILEPLTVRLNEAAFIAPILSPDGEKIAFWNRGVKDTIGILWLGDKELNFYPCDFSAGTSWGDSLVWSPDSGWLAFFSFWDQTDIRILNISVGNVYCITQDQNTETVMDWR